MRKLVASTLLSLDGVIGSPHLWAGKYFDDAAARYSLEHLLVSDAILMGRRTYEIFAGLWPGSSDPYSDRMNAIQKYVFSSTLVDASWNNTTIISGDVPTAVADLKKRDGQDLIMYGHGRLGQTLLEHGLLDEVRFMVLPQFVGDGDLLNRRGPHIALDLMDTQTLPSGIVVLTYRPL